MRVQGKLTYSNQLAPVEIIPSNQTHSFFFSDNDKNWSDEKKTKQRNFAPRAISWAKYQSIITNARWILHLDLKSVKRKLLVRALREFATAMLSAAVVRSGRNGLIDLFPPAFINLQISQVDRMRILEWVVFRSSSLSAGVFVTSLFFLLKFENFEISSLSDPQ